MLLLHDILAHNARIRPRRTALSSATGDISHAELWDRVRRCAAALAALGVKKGDRVAILSRSTPPYIGLLFAVTRLGAALVPLNHLCVAREHRAVLLDSSARLLLFAEEFQEVVDSLRPGLPGSLEFLRIESGGRGYAGVMEEGRADASPVPDRDLPSESDIALQIYKSGITEIPRGAMLSHASLMAASSALALELELSRRDVFLSCTSLPILGGIGRLLRFLYVGAKIVVHNDFSPEEVLRTIERERVTCVLFTPAMMAQILAVPSADRFNLATLRTVIYGGGPVSLDLLKRSIRFFGCDMVQTYGQVESSGILSVLHPEDHSLDDDAPYMRRLISVGREAACVEIRVVDEEGSEVPPGQPGEVTARGRNVFSGYHGDPDYTAQVLRDGWLYTGDVAARDEEGYLYLLDRKRDTLMSGGISVCPREVEKIIGEHPAVSESAVVALPDPVLGEVPAALVVFRDGRSAEIEDLLDHCRKNMASFKVPRRIEILSSLPRNSAGKVLKAKLREKMVMAADVTRRTLRR